VNDEWIRDFESYHILSCLVLNRSHIINDAYQVFDAGAQRRATLVRVTAATFGCSPRSMR